MTPLLKGKLVRRTYAPGRGPREPIDPQPGPLRPEATVIREQLKEPSPAEMAQNFVGAMAKWASSGFALVPREVYEARTAICLACEFWDGAARLGLGKCKAPGCGCTGMKRFLVTEKCPKDKWPTLAAK